MRGSRVKQLLKGFPKDNKTLRRAIKRGYKARNSPQPKLAEPRHRKSSFKGMRKDWKAGRLVIKHPVSFVGDFFADLSTVDRARALLLMEGCDHAPKHILDGAYLYLQEAAKREQEKRSERS